MKLLRALVSDRIIQLYPVLSGLKMFKTGMYGDRAGASHDVGEVDATGCQLKAGNETNYRLHNSATL
jgi:hypothetical protein